MSLLDTDQLAAIYDLAGPELAEMLEDFLTRSRESLGALGVTVAGGDLLAGAEIAHQLKGSAASMGLAMFHQRSGTVEKALRSGSRPGSEELGALAVILEDSVAEARAILGNG